MATEPTSDDSKFQIEVDEQTSIARNDMVEHAEHGPMRVNRIAVSAIGKRARLQSELNPVGLELSEEELREQWGETIHCDPAEIHDPNTARFSRSGIATEGVDIEVDIETSGSPQTEAELVHMHAIDQIQRALQAVANGSEPSECEGIRINIDWEKALEDDD